MPLRSPAAIVFAFVLIVGPAQVQAQSQTQSQVQEQTGAAQMGGDNPAPPDIRIRSLLERALARDDGTVFIQTLLVAMDAAPASATAIVRTALALAPDRAEAIAEAVTTAYPDRPDLAALFDGSPTADEPPGRTADAAPETDETEEAAREGIFRLAGWSGQLELGASKSSGDTDETAISLGLEVAQIIGEVWDHRFNLVGDYTRQAGVTSRERIDADYELFYRAWDRTYLFSFTGFEYDRFGGFDYRVTQAFGGGYTILRTPAMDWSVEAGPGIRWVQEETGMSNIEFVGRAGSDYAWRVNERVTLSNDTSFFIGTSRSTIENTVAVESNLIGALGLKLSFYVRHDTEAPAGTARTDTITRANIVYDF